MIETTKFFKVNKIVRQYKAQIANNLYKLTLPEDKYIPNENNFPHEFVEQDTGIEWSLYDVVVVEPNNEIAAIYEKV